MCMLFSWNATRWDCRRKEEKIKTIASDRCQCDITAHQKSPHCANVFSCCSSFDLEKIEPRVLHRQWHDSSDASTKEHASWHSKEQRVLVPIPFALYRVPSGRTGAVDHSACRSRGDWVGPRLRLPVTHSGSRARYSPRPLALARSLTATRSHLRPSCHHLLRHPTSSLPYSFCSSGYLSVLPALPPAAARHPLFAWGIDTRFPRTSIVSLRVFLTPSAHLSLDSSISIKVLSILLEMQNV